MQISLHKEHIHNKISIQIYEPWQSYKPWYQIRHSSWCDPVNLCNQRANLVDQTRRQHQHGTNCSLDPCQSSWSNSGHLSFPTAWAALLLPFLVSGVNKYEIWLKFCRNLIDIVTFGRNCERFAALASENDKYNVWPWPRLWPRPGQFHLLQVFYKLSSLEWWNNWNIFKTFKRSNKPSDLIQL